MELRRLLHLLRQRAWIIGLMVIAALAAGYAVTPRTATYRATAILYVGVPEQSSALYFNENLQAGQQSLAYSFAPLISQPTVVQAAIESSGLPRSAGQLAAETKATVSTGTNLINVTVTDPDPVVAQRAANAIGTQFSTQIAKIQPVGANPNGSGPTISPVHVFQPALLPTVPVRSSLRSNLILSGVFGLVISIGLVLLLDYLDLSVRTPEDLEARIDLPVLGVIPLLAGVSTNETMSQDWALVATGATNGRSDDRA
jgi:capsular polysaccharide biosynthesis protein